jgi:mannose-6-phosphate isomerase-like protein (cupin superfamily)
MFFKADDAIDPSSIQHRWTEVYYDGKPDSWVPEIGGHWHKHHDEYMNVLSGRVAFTLDGKTVILKPGDAPLHISAWHVHSFKFFKGEPSVLVERTDPVGDFKMDFFEDLLDTGEIDMVRAFRAFYNGDTYVALPFGVKLLDQAFTLALGAVITWWFPQQNKGMLAESVAKQPLENAT